MGVNGFKMFISLIIVAIMALVWRVHLTWNVLYVIPILMTLIVIVFGLGCFFLHYGVFVEDLSNVLNIALRFLFYLTGVFWDIMDRLPAPYNAYIGKGNPIAFLITSMRQCVIYGQAPHRKLLLMTVKIFFQKEVSEGVNDDQKNALKDSVEDLSKEDTNE